MTHPYILQLRPAVRLVSEGDDLRVACDDGRGLRSREPGPGVRALLQGLEQGGQTAEQLVAYARDVEPSVDASNLYFFLASLENKAFLSYTLAAEGQLLATLMPVSPAFRFNRTDHPGKLRLSRFACLRREGEVLLAESPLGLARLLLHDARLGALATLLSAPRSIDALAAALPEFSSALLAAMVALLCNAGVVFPCDDAGRIAEDADVSLRQWEFHDLLFHSRNRAGRHEYPLGGTYRFRDGFKDELPHASALKAPMSEERTALFRPAAESIGPDFYAVLDARRSRRAPGETPLRVRQLGEFLWRSARVQKHLPADPRLPESYECTLRPYPASGAMHELELYLSVTRCTGLESGLYHYDPLAHALERLADPDGKRQSMVQDAMRASGLKHAPDVLITIAARFGRVAWKYEGIAYALMQKNVGGMYQQMYLVACALGLAPCALGIGNSDTFAAATGMDYFAETSVGEFMLSGG